MSFDPRDYPATREQEEFERRQEKEVEDERQELLAQEAEEKEARETAFFMTETPFCELDCFDRLEHTLECRRFNGLQGVTTVRRAA